ncbi:hypothetical protein [Undibacterium sp. TJN19]|uniref:hypothetical protein n=1 Tax=Undibacterium sp. TJN19 TaxID=3413055 RepID=UPI003BF20E77
MGFGFLPLEKLPIFIWALILISAGGGLLFYEDFYSWGQLRAIFIVIAGVCAFVYDIKKRLRPQLDEQKEMILKKEEKNN